MATQDEIVTNFTNFATTEADDLTAAILAYHRGISAPMFDLSALDADHKTTIRDLSKQSLIKLRQRLELLLPAIRLATQAPDL